MVSATITYAGHIYASVKSYIWTNVTIFVLYNHCTSQPSSIRYENRYEIINQFDEGQGDLTKRGFAAELEACSVPVNVVADSLAGSNLILNHGSSGIPEEPVFIEYGSR
jgi:hypothetical protein